VEYDTCGDGTRTDGAVARLDEGDAFSDEDGDDVDAEFVEFALVQKGGDDFAAAHHPDVFAGLGAKALGEWSERRDGLKPAPTRTKTQTARVQDPPLGEQGKKNETAQSRPGRTSSQGLLLVLRDPPLGKDFLDAQFSHNGSPLWLKFSGYILNGNARELHSHSLLRVREIVVSVGQIRASHKAAGSRACKIREGNRVSARVGLID